MNFHGKCPKNEEVNDKEKSLEIAVLIEWPLHAMFDLDDWDFSYLISNKKWGLKENCKLFDRLKLLFQMNQQWKIAPIIICNLEYTQQKEIAR